MNKSKPGVLIVVGVVCAVIGMVLIMMGSNRQEENLKIAQNAQSAQEAAQKISSNNQIDTLRSTLGYGLTGFGIALTVGGVIVIVTRKKD